MVLFKRYVCILQKFCICFHPDKILFFVHNDDFFEPGYQSGFQTVEIENDSLSIHSNFLSGKKLNYYKNTQFLRKNSVYWRILDNCYEIYKVGLFDKVVFGKLNNFFAFLHKRNPKEENEITKRVTQKIPALNRQIIRSFAGNKKIYLVLADKPSPVVQQLMDTTGIQTIKIYPVLDSLKQRGTDPNYWKATNKEGHWNPEAHKAIGKALAAKLARLE